MSRRRTAGNTEPNDRSPGDPGNRTRRGRLKCCLLGCGSAIAFVSVAFVIAYFATGRYNPKISPARPIPKPNALDDYIAAGILFELNGGDKPLYGPDGEFDILNASRVVQANQPALARLREGFAKDCGIPFDPRFDVAFEYLSQLRSMARLLRAESEVFATGGNYGRAARSGLEAIHLGGDIERGGLLIHGLVGVAIQAIGQGVLEERIANLDVKTLDLNITLLQSRILKQVSVQDLLRTEHAWMITTLAKAQGSDGSDIAFPSTLEADGSGSGPRRMLGGLVWHFVRDKTLRDLDMHFDAVIGESLKPADTRSKIPEPGGIAGMLAPVFSQAQIALNRADLRNRLLLAEMAIRRYRLTKGKLPETLTNLGLDARVLVDPESHRQIVYRRKGVDYLLYGTGPDGKDNGGVPGDEAAGPVTGDLGIRAFRQAKPGSTPTRAYRRVPHMLAPQVPAGSPPLKD